MGQLPKWAQECGKSRLHRTLLPLSKEGQIPPEVESRNLFNMNNLKESTRNRLHIDASRGVAGDMLLAALIDLGVPPEVVISPLSEALPAHSLEFATESRRGIGGCRAMVELVEPGIADGGVQDAARVVEGVGTDGNETAVDGHGRHPVEAYRHCCRSGQQPDEKRNGKSPVDKRHVTASSR